MGLPKHLEEAVARLKEASVRIKQARAKPMALESHREWLDALTDFSMALSDIHEFTNESIHEKLHEIAGRLGMKRFP
jgi:galactose-1-phosphate uridylyltransferase